jgi:predicted TPR repeat methyltransferase
MTNDAELAEIDRLRERLLIAPRDDAAMASLAALHERAGDLPQAIDLLQRSLRVDPYRSDALVGLGRVWAALGETGRARHWYERALAADPDCRDAVAGLAALEEGLTEAYVRTLFDQYAGRFDAELTGTLDYRAPELVAGLLARHGHGKGPSAILDLGCGTGLSGAALRPFACSLDGVDLSPGMIAEARRRGIYDRLDTDEVLRFLTAADRRWQVVAAVDMLNYVGDLEPLLVATAGRLEPGGLVVGTVEKCAKGIVLTQKRRYAHGVDHLERAAAAAGLEMLEISEGVLRREGGMPVTGLVFALERRLFA